MKNTLLLIAFCSFILSSFAQNNPGAMKPYDFEKAWKQVVEHEQKGLPQSALQVVNEIYQAAKQENNAAQLVKAVIHRLKFTHYREENAFIKSLIDLKAEAAQATFPAKPLLHSMLGELYWQYYQNNRYRYFDRSETAAVNETDIETWSLEKIVQETFAQYHQSFQYADQSKNTRIDIYDEVLYTGNSLGRAYRPTLYDFLAHRAINFFSGEEPSITKPVYTFVLDKEVYLAHAQTFATLALESKDTLSMKYDALVLLQELIRFHLNDADKGALVTLDLQRLHFVRENTSLPNKDELYLRALEQLEKSTGAHPSAALVAYYRALVYNESAVHYRPLVSDAHKWDFKTAYEICEAAKKNFPESEGAIHCEQLQHNIRNKTLGAIVENVNVPGQPFRCQIQYSNFTPLHYRIIKIARTEVATQRRKWNRSNEDDPERTFIEYFLAKTPLKTGSFTLPNDGDYHQHTIEVKMDALPAGEYMIIFSNLPDFSRVNNSLVYEFTTISNIAYIHRRQKDGSMDFYVMNRQTGEPMAGVKAEVFVHEYNYKKQEFVEEKKASFTSDANGYFRIGLMSERLRNNFLVNFNYREDFNSTVNVSDAGYSGSLYQFKQGKPETFTRTIFFLDRAIYRPGQTIYFKGLVYDTDGKSSTINKNYSTTIRLMDVNHEMKGELQVTSNDYGTFSGTFTAPSSGLFGQMQLQTSDGTGSIAFSVEEYKRPKFEVKMEPVKGSFRLGEKIHTVGSAQAYSGANIDGATVRYRIERAARFPFWWWCRWGAPSKPSMEITSGTTTTGADGKFAIDFAAIADPTVDPASDPVFDFIIYADVTDINGETRSASTTVSVGYKALEVNVDMENMDKQDIPAKPPVFNIKTTNTALEFEPAKGEIKIFRLQSPTRAFRARFWNQPDRKLYSREEYYKLFPYDLFEDENNKFTWPRQREVFSLSFDTEREKTFSISNLAQWDDGEYVLEITSKDKYGQPVKEVSYFTLYNTGARNIPLPLVHYFQGVKLRAEPGEQASFVAGTADGKVRALYEVQRDGDIISHEWVNLNNNQHQFTIPVREEHRGNLVIHYAFVKNNRLYTEAVAVVVPYSNKQLDITFETFRDKLQPGQQEQWKIVVKGKTADKIAAEMVATLYDASLDVFRPHHWSASFFGALQYDLGWESVRGFNDIGFSAYARTWNPPFGKSATGADFDALNWFGYSFSRRYYESETALRGAVAGVRVQRSARYRDGDDELQKMEAAKPMAVMEVAADAADTTATDQFGVPEEPVDGKGGQADFSDVKVRSNFNETAFFYPHLLTNEKGEIIISFTIPEALTRWKMLGFAHTEDLKSGLTTNTLVTQKELMVVPNQPRFFRENDKMIFSAKVSSLVDYELQGQAQLEFFDALTMKPVNVEMKNSNALKNFSVAAKQSTNLEWSIEIPAGLQAVSYKIVARAGSFSDGEEMVLPVVTNSMLVTETLPLPVRGKQTKAFRFEKLLHADSKTLRHQQFTLEYTSNPAWYAVQALPYLMEYPYDCVEQTFSRFYANSIATHIANANPRIKQVFDTWKNVQPDALLSNLEKNQELKSALLEETPWVLQARDESQRKRMVGVLFDLNRMAREQDKALDKIVKAQTPSGGFTWFPGFPEDRYMTQHIVCGLGHLDVMGVKSVREERRTLRMTRQALDYLDEKIREDYARLKAMANRKEIKLEDKHIQYIQIHYLYARSYFRDVPVANATKEAFDYFLGQAKKYWLSDNIYLEGMICLALHRYGDKTTTAAMIKSFSERALHHEEMGMYWKNGGGYYWYQAPIETQALMIEVYDEVAADAASVEALKVWLLKQKQTQDWKTTKATVEACYALLRRGANILASENLVQIKIADQTIDPARRPDAKLEAGTGYFKTAWKANEVSNDMGKITVTKTDDGVAWGAAYWQYFEQLDKITPAETPLKLKKELFKEINSDRGPVIVPVNEQNTLQVGDLIKVRIELRSDRNLEYVHLKDMRAAGFEPVSTLSTHRYQDGLYYYESTRDLSTNFFIGYLPKGTYVFEYALRVSQKGDFSNGITTIQCMYAPEFTSHSAGIRVLVDK